jgi:hypothetical protein
VTRIKARVEDLKVGDVIEWYGVRSTVTGVSRDDRRRVVFLDLDRENAHGWVGSLARDMALGLGAVVDQIIEVPT